MFTVAVVRFAISYQPAIHGADPDSLTAYAQHAEACGFEALYLPEHVALTPGTTFGTMAMPATTPFLDPVDCLAFVAAATTRLLLGTGVLLLPYHHPVTLAKRLATVDALSKGRLRLLTVGVGALPAEAQAVGVDFTTRGRRTDEAIDVLRLLWSGGADGVSHTGEFFEFENLCSFPQPAGGTLPIHIGGSSRAAARRAGLRGDGYFAGGALPLDERARQFEQARKAATDAGRDPDALEYTRWGSIDMPASAVEELAEQGVTRVVVAAGPADPLAQMSSFAERFGLG